MLTKQDLQQIKTITKEVVKDEVQTIVRKEIDRAVETLANSTRVGFDEVHTKLDEHTRILKEHSNILHQHSEQFKKTNNRLDSVEHKVDSKQNLVDNHDRRISRLEKQTGLKPAKSTL